MSRVRVLAAVAATVVLLAGGALDAHHGWGSYDAANPVTVEGQITASSYQNPHATIRLKGPQKEWTVTLAPVSRMSARGATQDKVAVGKTISAYGYPSKTQPDEMRAEWIKADGETYQLR
jgi:Family of unknown function (DUF6152)